MKNLLSISIVTAAALFGLFLISADHIDAPAVTGAGTDIADYYAFESPTNTNNMVFAVTLQGLLSPSATSGARFDENVLVEINIDNDGDQIEDLVIQAIPKDGRMYVYGPIAPTRLGTISEIETAASSMSVEITPYGSSAIVNTSGNSRLFAGPRDDPFFFDLAAYTEIIAGNATSFNSNGTDAFAGTNVLAIVVEVPKSSLGSASSIDTWVESKIKQ